MKHFFIGDEVYVPKHKMIGTISDKIFEHYNDEIILRIEPKEHLSNVAYGNSMKYSTTFVKYSTVKSLKTTDLYHKQIEQSEIEDLNIPNLLKKKDIIKGTRIKVVDNYMLERIITYSQSNRLYSKLFLSFLLDKKGILTGKSIVLSNGVLAAECLFNDYSTYYVYDYCIQVTKRADIFKRVSNFFKKIPTNFWIISVYLIGMLATSVIVFLLKH